MSAQMLLQSFAGGDEEKTYIEDVFSTYLYTGNGSTQTINNGIDLAGKGGLVWMKHRGIGGTAQSNVLMDTIRGGTKAIYSNTTQAQDTVAWISSFNNNGFSLSTGAAYINGASQGYASWTFRKAPKFFKCATVTKSVGSNATVDLSSLGTVGMVTVKRTDADGDWYTWHRSLPAGQLVYLNQPATVATLGHITVSGTTLTLVNGVIADGTYVVYAWAHDTSANGLIQCGSFTTDANGNATVNLGWEPQWVLSKRSSGTQSWRILDSMRDFGVNSWSQLNPNESAAEYQFLASTYPDGFIPTSTGFKTGGEFLYSSSTHIYLAIRRGPMRVPTDGSKVFKPLTRTGTGAAATVTGVGFAPDWWLCGRRDGANDSASASRFQGTNYLYANNANAESTGGEIAFDNMLGVNLTFSSVSWNTMNAPYVHLFFRRAPGFFDIVCDTGTGAAHAINHSLTVAPELIIRKSRSANTQWEWWHSALAATEKLVLNSTAAKATDATAFGTLPTATQFYVGASSNTNASAATYVTYLFATCPGVSKVFSYIGNGSSQTINCGFSGGARFVLIKASSATGSWWIYDTARGIVSSADPALQLNSTVAEISTADAIDPDPSGFIVNQEASCSINANGVSYVGLAIS